MSGGNKQRKSMHGRIIRTVRRWSAGKPVHDLTAFFIAEDRGYLQSLPAPDGDGTMTVVTEKGKKLIAEKEANHVEN